MTMPLDAHDDVPDEALLVLFANGDSVAARVLTLRLTPRVMAHAYRLLGNRAEAEDVAQEAMLRLWKQARDWRQGEAKVTTWLYRVVANLCIDRQRRARGGPVALDAIPEPADERASADETLQERARAEALQAALDTLPERQRQAVVLRHIEGLANPEIAEIMEITIEAVESLTSRGKRALSAALAGRQKELGYVDER
ncbi:ECF RNA polymerase sigma factor SigE [Roseovarius sp. A-2]|uniref:RNA polymerase sigma factor n=1 Tax=Roseovarius sp. A-2 TaxID=1570360 RepID=UPI0009B53DF3|nr:RNA polymerase sigma factor [Roseovarius sp. A-2]GAW36040.1 ECF RNA polymerase sigma factor SigE [Roseovarius sp. A-2]